MPQAELIIMGSGGSQGVPVAGNGWGVCDPAEPKNVRLRASVAVRTAQTSLVIDTGHDFRQQVNTHDIKKIDAVLYTHVHGDHTHGIDGLRPYYDRQKAPIPIYGLPETITELHQRFDYILRGAQDGTGLYPAIVAPTAWDDTAIYTPQQIGDIGFQPYLQDHNTCRSLGFRFGNVAYSTDMVDLDDRAIAALQGLDVWIADGGAIGFTGPLVHANLEKIIALNAKIGAREVYLTHLTHRIDYQATLKTLPEGYFMAYDGLKFTCTL